MSNLKDIFDVFPNYDVFDENNEEIRPRKKPRRKGNDFNYIQYDEKRDFRTQKPPEATREPAEHSADYRDGYGVYRVYEERIKNSASLFFFPFAIIWLEVFLRLGCGQTLFTFNMVFVSLFSLSISSVFSILCTFFNEKFNRFMVKVIVLLLTILYCVQMIHFNVTDKFLLLSGSPLTIENLESFNNVMNVMSDKVFYLLGSFFPFVLFLFFGRYIFPFRKIRTPGRICLLLVAILLHFSALTILSVNKNEENPTSYYSVYHNQADSTLIQENFGLYTMEVKDFLN